MNGTLRMILFFVFISSDRIAFAQTPIQFLNTLDAPINLILTNTQDGSESVIGPIARNDVGDFVIPDGASVFDIRLMPQDNTETGFRFTGRNLANIAANSGGRAVPVGGILKTKCYVYSRCKRHCRRRCRGAYRSCRTERVAAFVDEFVAGGRIERTTVPVEPY